MTGRVAVEARITGRVQGVYYRAWCREQAERRGLSGWVRNEPDGSVTAVFVGPEEAVEAMIRACHDGPLDARVEAVETHSLPGPEPSETGFEIRR